MKKLSFVFCLLFAVLFVAACAQKKSDGPASVIGRRVNQQNPNDSLTNPNSDPGDTPKQEFVLNVGDRLAIENVIKNDSTDTATFTVKNENTGVSKMIEVKISTNIWKKVTVNEGVGFGKMADGQQLCAYVCEKDRFLVLNITVGMPKNANKKVVDSEKYVVTWEKGTNSWDCLFQILSLAGGNPHLFKSGKIVESTNNMNCFNLTDVVFI
jgi:hypothetical protein